MLNKEETDKFINDSWHAINHIFDALEQYNRLLINAQHGVEEINNIKNSLSDLFMYRDQWSPDANHHYAVYMHRLEELKKREQEICGKDYEER